MSDDEAEPEAEEKKEDEEAEVSIFANSADRCHKSSS